METNIQRTSSKVKNGGVSEKHITNFVDHYIQGVFRAHVLKVFNRNCFHHFS